ncbi:MAG TPA: hypothetical protein VEW42_06090 [Candidatus Eisenbacteria bacterium]|nr:hypothetical protein [Candidatus Eisenbacteria bacterium]
MGIKVVDAGNSNFPAGTDANRRGARRTGKVYGGNGEFCTITILGDELGHGGTYHVYPHSPLAEHFATDGFQPLSPGKERTIGSVILRAY